MQNAKWALQNDPQDLQGNPDRTELYEHIDQYNVDKGAYQRTLERLSGLGRDGAQAACALRALSEDELAFDPASVLPPAGSTGRVEPEEGGGFGRGGGGSLGGGHSLEE